MIDSLDMWVVPYREPNDHNSMRYSIMVQIKDSSGAVGWGEAVTIFEEEARATLVILEGWAPFLLGHSSDPHSIRETVLAHAWWYAGGGSASFALSALDIAAWDITGHLHGKSVVNLLGGVANESNPTLPIIVSTHAFYENLSYQADFLAQCVHDADARGVKVGWGKKGGAGLGVDPLRDETFARLLREALPAERLMMFDIGAKITWSVEEAMSRVQLFEPYDLYWIEEPLGADNPEGYKLLRESTSTLIAYGEREWSATGVRRILATGTVDVVGIDAGRAEGITGFVDAVRSIEQASRQVNAHAFAGPSSYAAGLAVSLTTTACRQFEVAPLRNELMTRLAPGLAVPVHDVGVLSGDGLGVEIDHLEVKSMAIASSHAH